MPSELLDEIPAKLFIYPAVFYAQIGVFVFPSVTVEIRLRLFSHALYIGPIDYILKI